MTSFDSLIETLIFDNYNSIPDFVRDKFHMLDSKSLNAKIRSIRRYVANVVVPSYSVAESLLELFDISIEEHELLSSLHQAREKKSSNSFVMEKGIYKRKIVLNFSDINLNDMNVADIEKSIERRIIAKTKNNSLNEYLIKLIQHDLEFYTLDLLKGEIK